jgi:hypothetical protein
MFFVSVDRFFCLETGARMDDAAAVGLADILRTNPRLRQVSLPRTFLCLMKKSITFRSVSRALLCLFSPAFSCRMSPSLRSMSAAPKITESFFPLLL